MYTTTTATARETTAAATVKKTVLNKQNLSLQDNSSS